MSAPLYKEIEFYAINSSMDGILISSSQYDKRFADCTSHVVAKIPLVEYNNLKDKICPESKRVSVLLDTQYTLTTKLEKLQAEVTSFKRVINLLGPWASAALSDDTCCQELKDVFEQVLKLNGGVL